MLKGRFKHSRFQSSLGGGIPGGIIQLLYSSTVLRIKFKTFCFFFITFTVRHVGDLGNIEADASGVAKFNIEDKLVKLSGEHSVVGRSIVVRQYLVGTNHFLHNNISMHV